MVSTETHIRRALAGTVQVILDHARRNGYSDRGLTPSGTSAKTAMISGRSDRQNGSTRLALPAVCFLPVNRS